ncbi:MAG: tetratricopeptide repeat protein [Bacteroidales bacterium]|nr:tetratricopeptide repeat protein [Bacteroidales bacterium]
MYLVNKQNYSSAILYFLQAQKFYEAANDLEKKAICNSSIAAAYYYSENYPLAIENYESAIQIFISIKNDSLTVKHYNDLGFLYFNLHRYRSAQTTYFKALKLNLKNKTNSECAKSYYYIGNLFYEQYILDSALFYYKTSLVYDKKAKDTLSTAFSYNNISTITYNMGNLEVSETYLDSSRAIIEKLSNLKAKAIILNNQGNIYFEYGNLEQAQELYYKSLTLKKELEFEEGYAISIYNLGNIFRKKGNNERAISLYDSSIVYAQKYSDVRTIAANYKALSELYTQTKDHEKAYEYYTTFVLIQSSMYEDDKEQLSESINSKLDKRNFASGLEREILMQKLFSKYNASLKDREISALKQSQKYQLYTNLLYAGILFFMILAAILIYIRYKRKQKTNKLLSDKNEELQQQNIIILNQADELKQSNQELEKLTIVAQKTDNAVMIMDAQGNFEWVNDAYTKIFGYSYEELLAISANLINYSSPQYIKEKFIKCTSEKCTVDYELKTLTKEGKELWLNITLTPILNDKGEISRLVCIDTDITMLKKAEKEIVEQKDKIEKQRDALQQQNSEIIEQKDEIDKQKEELTSMLEQLQRTQKKLVESEKMAALGNLVAGISHEINTPVGIGIAASSTMVTKTSNLEELFETKKMKISDLQAHIESTQQACELILSNLNRTAELVKSFKQVSVDNMTEQTRIFNLDEYLHDITRSLAPKLKHRPIKLEIICPSDIELKSFPGAFAQIFTNFIINSTIHAFDENQEGLIQIKAEIANDHLLLLYSDNGKGIPPENLKKIFDPFFTTNMQVGTGLGMNITYNLVTQKLGGEISLESELNKGVTFTIKLPLSLLATV